MLAGCAARIHVDRHQCFGLVDHQIAAGFQRHLIGEHRIQLRFDAVTGKQRLRVAIGFDVAGMARHEHAHEVLGILVGGLARDNHLVDIFVIEIADRTFDQRAFFIDQRGGGRLHGQFADIFPQAHQIFEIALDFRLGAGRTCRAQDDAHAIRHFQILCDCFQTLAIHHIGDLARNAAATTGIGHQHRITASQRQIGGQRRTLVAAFFLDNLHQQNLAALDHFLDFVLAAIVARTLRHFFHRIFGADLFDAVIG